jgi:D-3-phosphoglycerate dehydrogenase / 2-oxoglutarate reductase
MIWKVMITDVSFPDVSLEQAELQSINASLVRLNCLTAADVIQQCQEADALLVQYAPITADVLRALPRLKAISRYGIGVDMIDISAATQNKILVCSVPGYCVKEVATHALAIILYWARRLSTYQQDVRNKRWNLNALDDAHRIHRLDVQTLGLVGAGRIAQELAKMASFLGMKIVYYDPYIKTDPIQEMQAVSFEELITTSDFISIHCPLTQESRGLFDEPIFKAMKSSAVLVNTARGAVVNNSALEKALRYGWIAGAGVDNLEQEPPDWNDPLLTLQNLLVTPHVAFYSEESLSDLQRLTAKAIADLFSCNMPEGLLNSELFPGFIKRMLSDER